MELGYISYLEISESVVEDNSEVEVDGGMPLQQAPKIEKGSYGAQIRCIAAEADICSRLAC